MQSDDRDPLADEGGDERPSRCHTEREIFAFVDGSAGESSAATIDGHVRRCRTCARKAQLARELMAPPAPVDGRPDDLEFVLAQGERAIPHIVRRHGRPRWLSVAPGALAAMAAAVTIAYCGIVFGPALIGRLDRPIGVVAPLGEVTSAPDELRWNPVPGAAEYRVQIRDVDSDEVQDVSCPATASAVPVEPIRFTAATRYAWTVDAIDVNGSVIARSHATAFVVSPDTAQGPYSGTAPSILRAKRR
ncbi:MAG: hypothetical protein HYR85_17220 [Planctomycetes bacterium]|nr:hypothetical protein [Planctomycetota bacterium]MBI3845382.1 hypothetical protein [Planctomycetota bacterium]